MLLDAVLLNSVACISSNSKWKNPLQSSIQVANIPHQLPQAGHQIIEIHPQQGSKDAQSTTAVSAGASQQRRRRRIEGREVADRGMARGVAQKAVNQELHWRLCLNHQATSLLVTIMADSNMRHETQHGGNTPYFRG